MAISAGGAGPTEAGPGSDADERGSARRAGFSAGASRTATAAPFDLSLDAGAASPGTGVGFGAGAAVGSGTMGEASSTSALGRYSVKVLPSPTVLLSVISPPSSRTSSRLIDRTSA